MFYDLYHVRLWLPHAHKLLFVAARNRPAGQGLTSRFEQMGPPRPRGSRSRTTRQAKLAHNAPTGSPAAATVPGWWTSGVEPYVTASAGRAATPTSGGSSQTPPRCERWSRHSQIRGGPPRSRTSSGSRHEASCSALPARWRRSWPGPTGMLTAAGSTRWRPGLPRDHLAQRHSSRARTFLPWTLRRCTQCRRRIPSRLRRPRAAPPQWP